MTKVFDCRTKTDTDRKKLSESIFAYWNRSAQPSAEASRALIEDWFSQLPEVEQNSFRSRFRSGSDPDCGAAFQELCLHELLLRQRCQMSFHHAVAGTTNRPD